MKKMLCFILAAMIILFVYLPAFADEAVTLVEVSTYEEVQEVIEVVSPTVQGAGEKSEPVKPEPSAQPPQTDEPVATDKPTTPDEPTATDKPTTPDEPTATDKPTTPDEPTATEEPTTPSEPTATEEPASPSEPTATEEPAVTQAPVPINCSVRILCERRSISYGQSVELKSELTGFDGLSYSLQWQYYTDDEWHNAPGGNASTYTFVITEENANYGWRLKVTM